MCTCGCLHSGFDDPANLPEIVEIERAADLLEASRASAPRSSLTTAIQRTLAEAAADPIAPETLSQLVGGIRRLVDLALPRAVPRHTAVGTTPAELFGIELEGLSPEDAELETARRILRFVRATGHVAAAATGRPANGNPSLSAANAARVAARRWAPGLLRTAPVGSRFGAPSRQNALPHHYPQDRATDL
jgi:hypothetical protein